MNRFLMQLLYLPITIFMASVEAMGRMFSAGQRPLAAGMAGGPQAGTSATPASSGIAGSSVAPSGATTVIKKENGMSMNDQDLSGDSLKNVVYSILFTKRDLEATLQPQTEDIVNYSTNGASYAALKLSEFAASGTTFPLPDTWFENDYPRSWPRPMPTPRPQLTAADIREEDRRYITLVYRVKDQIQKTEADYQKRQTKAIEGIRTILDQRL